MSPALHAKVSDPPLPFEAAVKKVKDEDRQKSEQQRQGWQIILLKLIPPTI